MIFNTSGVQPAMIFLIVVKVCSLSPGFILSGEYPKKNPFSLQLGKPKEIAKRTKIVTVGNFRKDDINKGGQGAPLSPLFHKAFFSKEKETKCILNIGGIANLTILNHSESEKSLKYSIKHLLYYPSII